MHPRQPSVYSHILREASASLLVPTIPGIPEPRSVGTGSKYGSHAFSFLPVNHFSSNGNDCRGAQPAASIPMRRHYFNWKVLIAMLISFLALAQVAWAATETEFPDSDKKLFYDYNQDGDIECILYNGYDDGRWIKATSYGPSILTEIVIYEKATQLADIDGDGWIDAIDKKGFFYFGDQYGNFSLVKDIDKKALSVVDVSNDGRLQLLDISGTDVPTRAISFAEGSNPVYHHVDIMSANAYRLTGKPMLGGLPSLADGMFVGGGTSAVKFAEFLNADLTGDGIPDIYSPDDGKVYAGTGDGSFIELHMPGNMKLRDLDGDGVTDIVTYDEATKTLTVHFVSADGTVTSKSLLKGLYCSTNIWLYDFDKDGDVDILVPFDKYINANAPSHDNGGSYLVMFENRGNRSFKKHENYIEGDVYWADCVDTDADGNYEVLGYVGYYPNQTVKAGTYQYKVNSIKVNTTPIVLDETTSIKQFADLTNSGIIHALNGSSYTPLSSKINQRPQMPACAPVINYNPEEQLLNVTWQRGTDAESSPLDLTYEVRVSSTSGKNDIVVANALSDGTRRNLLEGREGYGTTRTFNVSSWPAGTYYIDVQAIDPNRRGSAFSQAAVWTKTAISADFNIEYVRPFAVGDTCRVVATASPRNDETYDWELDGATILSDNANHSEMRLKFDSPGEKALRLNVVDANGKVLSSSAKTILVKRANLKPYDIFIDSQKFGVYQVSCVADFNADGENEMFAYSKFRQENSNGIWEGVKKIYNTNLPAGDHWTFMADVNHDGLPDLISHTDDSRYKFLIINLGDMDMEVDTDRPKVDILGWKLVSDLDNDGDPEVVSGQMVLKHDADYNPTIEAASHDIKGTIIACHDIDGDGLRDIITETNEWSGGDWIYHYKLYLNQGNSVFKEDDSLLPEISEEYRIATVSIDSYGNSQYAIGDFDNDGKLDAAVYLYDSPNRLEHHAIAWNDGSLTPTVSVTPESGQGSDTGKGGIMDFDNNGFDDIVIGGTGEHYIIHMLPNRKFEIESRNVSDTESQVARWFLYPKFYNPRGEFIGKGIYDNSAATYCGHYFSKIEVANTRPEAPSGVVVNETDRGVVIDWTHAVDMETPGVKMLYNISVRRKGVEGEDSYLISPMNGEVDFAPVPQSSDLRRNDILWSGNRFLIPKNVIANGEYIVRIQAVDAMMATSAFSAPVEFTVKGGGFGTLPAAVKAGAAVQIVTAEHVGGNIDWDGGKVIAHNGHSYTVTWSKEGVKTISDGTYTAQLNVLKPADASFFGIPDEVTVLDKCNAACATAADGRWEVSFDGVDFKLVSDVEVKHAEFEIDPSANRITMQFGTTGDVYVRHTVPAPYGEEVFTKKYTVRRASERPAIDIVDIDPATGRLRITPTEQTADHVIGWNIYRETSVANKYELIGTILKGSGNRSFVDPLSEPSSHSSRYTLSWILDYGESLECEPHQSLHVMINRAAGNAINLMWSPYEGREVASYRILRGATVASMTPIATVSGSVRSYADLTPDVAQPLYSVEMVCKAETRADATSVRSNVVSTADAYYTTMVSGIEIISDGNRTDIGGDNFSDLQLNAVVTPITANYRNVHWAVVAGEDIATVSSSGLVEMKDDVPSGTVVIRALAMDGSGAYGEITLNAMSAIGDTRVDRMADGELTCSPWAVDTDLTVDGMTDGELTHLIIFDLSGVVCKSVEVDGSSVTLSVDNLVPGHYFVRAESRSGISKGRFVKK